jgi:two-component sensor histidine kinase
MPRGWLEALSARVRASSIGPYLFALAIVALALFARVVLGWMGATLQYVPYYPAILFIAFIAGPQAAAAATFAVVTIVWWAFTPPYYRFSPLGTADLANMVVFVGSSALVIWLAQLYRMTVSRLRTEERHRELMLRELEHRGKNTFAVVEAIVRNTLGSGDDANTIVGRVRSVSSTNDIINKSPTHRASLLSIIRNEFEPYGLERVRCTSSDLDLNPHTSRHIALVLHELVTNAVKHGALSTADGFVAIEWVADGAKVKMRWAERNGPQAVTPETYGFGARLVTSTLKALGGGIEADFSPQGLTCEITFRQA